MDVKLRQLLELYEGRSDDAPGQESLSGQQSELTMLREVKERLDARPRRRPRPGTIDAVVAAARIATPEDVRRDRSAINRRRPRRLAGGVLTLALLFIAIASWITLSQETSGPEIAPLAELPPTESVEESTREEVTRSVTPAVEIEQPSIVERTGDPVKDSWSARPARAEVTPASLTDDTDRIDEVLAWDQREEIRQLYQRVERLASVSPSVEQWRAAPVRNTLTAPVGLTAQHAMMRADF